MKFSTTLALKDLLCLLSFSHKMDSNCKSKNAISCNTFLSYFCIKMLKELANLKSDEKFKARKKFTFMFAFLLLVIPLIILSQSRCRFEIHIDRILSVGSAC